MRNRNHPKGSRKNWTLSRIFESYYKNSSYESHLLCRSDYPGILLQPAYDDRRLIVYGEIGKYVKNNQPEMINISGIQNDSTISD